MAMKKLLILLTIIFGLSSCIPSNEKKAEQMAAKYIKEILYHPESYEPIETRVDSSFISMDLLNETKNLFKLLQIIQEYASKSNRAERTMAIYVPSGYYSGYGTVEYRQAKQEFDRYQRLLQEKTEQLINQFDKIKSLQSATRDHNFNGWFVYHRYSGSNGLGNVLTGEFIFLCDKNFNIKEAYPIEEYNIMIKVMDIIMQSKDLQDFVDMTEEFSITNNNYGY